MQTEARTQARVYAVTQQDADAAPDVVTGIISILDHDAYMMSLKVIYFQSIFLIDFYIKRMIFMQESGINFTKLLCSRKLKRKQKLQ